MYAGGLTVVTLEYGGVKLRSGGALRLASWRVRRTAAGLCGRNHSECKVPREMKETTHTQTGFSKNESWERPRFIP